jgi:alpha,alpha-trehalose phosphorylase (configuration-retaining)
VDWISIISIATYGSLSSAFKVILLQSLFLTMFLSRRSLFWAPLQTGKLSTRDRIDLLILFRLDGLNKELDSWDSTYYMGEFRTLCAKEKMQELQWPVRDYIIQIARFDPAKGIPDVIDSYVKFRRLLRQRSPDIDEDDEPQLLICGHGAVDDPDASIIYDQVMQIIQSDNVKEFSKDIVVMRLPPSDQREFQIFARECWLSLFALSVLNALMSNAKIALQLSTREGFEVKVSEAVHAGIPIIACQTGGIPLQVQDGKSGFLVAPRDSDAVAQKIYDLFTDDQLYQRMSEYAKTHVSDEVGTVGNAAAWLYLAVMYASRKQKLKPNGAWLNDMLREETGQPYVDSETKLPREQMKI